MCKASVQLSFKQIITVKSSSAFEQQVHAATYHEFLLKSQTYNLEQQFKTFSQMKANDGKANSLHYKTGFAADGLIAGLHNYIPAFDQVPNKSLKFDSYQFEVIESHIEDRNQHAIAIVYIAQPLFLVDSFGDWLLVTLDNQTTNGFITDTFTVQLSTQVSIAAYKAL